MLFASLGAAVPLYTNVGQQSPTVLPTWCRLVEDTAWHPVMKTEVDEWTGAKAFLFKTFLGSPLKLWASVGHWLIWHFDLGKFSENQKPRVRAAGLLLLR